MNETEWITTRDAMSITGYSQEYIRRMAREGRITARKWGPVVQISKASLLEHKAEQDRIRQKGGGT